MGAFAYVTFITNDSYGLGALVLAHSLRQSGTIHKLVVLITPGVTSLMRETLHDVFDLVKEVDILDSGDAVNLKLLKRPELGITFTKLYCWRLTQFDRCVFLDADTMVLDNVDELFQREELSAAPDVGWPDCFNSGVFVYQPSEETFNNLIQFAISVGSFDGGDQGLLNLYFSTWSHQDIRKHLPFIYNMCSTATYSYLPAYKQFAQNAKIIHFIGKTKPWMQKFDPVTHQLYLEGELLHLEHYMQRWWDIFCFSVHPTLNDQMAGLAGAFAQLDLDREKSAHQQVLDDHFRRQRWEEGNIDYMGRDSFNNIWCKISETIQQPSTSHDEPPISGASPSIDDDDDGDDGPEMSSPKAESGTKKTETTEHKDKLKPNQVESDITKVASSTAAIDKSLDVLHKPVAAAALTSTAKTTTEESIILCPMLLTSANPSTLDETKINVPRTKQCGSETKSSDKCDESIELTKTVESYIVPATTTTKPYQKGASDISESNKILQKVSEMSIERCIDKNEHSPISDEPTDSSPILSKDESVIQIQSYVPVSVAQTSLCADEIPKVPVTTLSKKAAVKLAKETIPMLPKETVPSSKEVVPKETVPILLKEVVPELSKETSPLELTKKTVQTLAKETVPPTVLNPSVVTDSKAASATSVTKSLKSETTKTSSPQAADTPVAPPRKSSGSGGEKKKGGKGKK